MGNQRIGKEAGNKMEKGVGNKANQPTHHHPFPHHHPHNNPISHQSRWRDLGLISQQFRYIMFCNTFSALVISTSLITILKHLISLTTLKKGIWIRCQSRLVFPQAMSIMGIVQTITKQPPPTSLPLPTPFLSTPIPNPRNI